MNTKLKDVKIIDRCSDPFFEYNGKQEQVFGRWYTADNGMWMPSVTTCINPVTGYHPKSGENFADVSEKLAKRKAETGRGSTLSEYRDAAAVRGTAIHKLCESIDNGEAVDLSSVEDDKRDDIAAYLRWKAEQPKRRVVQTELFVFSLRYGIAGQLDCLSFDEEVGKYKIEDKKSGRKVKVYAGWQMAAYALCAEEMGLIDKAEDCLLEVQQIRDGNVRVFKYQHFDWLRDSFLACLQCWKALNWNFGLMKLAQSGRYIWLKEEFNKPEVAAA